MARKTERRLVGDVHVQNPDGGSEPTMFAAGTRASEMPAWALDAIGNPHAWDDSTRDDRVEFVILPRLAANGAPPDMIDDVRDALAAAHGTDEYETSIRELLAVTTDAPAIAQAIVAHRQHTIQRGGETYLEYLERAAQLGSTPASFDEFLASDGVIVEAGDDAVRGGETFDQYLARAAVAGFEPVEHETFLEAPADVAVGPSPPADPPPAPDAGADVSAGAAVPDAGLTVTPVPGVPDVTVQKT